MSKNMLKEEYTLFTDAESQIHTFCLRLAFPWENSDWKFEIVAHSHDVVPYIESPEVIRKLRCLSKNYFL